MDLINYNGSGFEKDTHVWLPDDEDIYVPSKVMGTFKAEEKRTVMNLNNRHGPTIVGPNP